MGSPARMTSSAGRRGSNAPSSPGREDALHVGPPQDRADQLRDQFRARHDQDLSHPAPLEFALSAGPRAEAARPRSMLGTGMDTRIPRPTSGHRVRPRRGEDGASPSGTAREATGERGCWSGSRTRSPAPAAGRAPQLPLHGARRRAPDKPAVLEPTARAVADHARRPWARPSWCSGASRWAAASRPRRSPQGTAARRPRLPRLSASSPRARPTGRRDRHLPAITAPMLFVQGTRDAFARADLLEALVAASPPGHPPPHRGRRSLLRGAAPGRRPGEVQAEVFGAILRWLEAHAL